MKSMFCCRICNFNCTPFMPWGKMVTRRLTQFVLIAVLSLVTKMLLKLG